MIVPVPRAIARRGPGEKAPAAQRSGSLTCDGYQASSFHGLPPNTSCCHARSSAWTSTVDRDAKAKGLPRVKMPADDICAAVYGDPGKDGLFVLRLKLPKGYAIPPHTHPKPEIVTVI